MDDLKKVIEDIESGKFSISVHHNGKRIFALSESGIFPLVKFIVDHKETLYTIKGAVIGDKVIGKAGVLLILNLEPSFIYGSIMSKKAKDLIENMEVKLKYKKLVPKILNADKTDNCPMEKLAATIDSSEEALNVFKNFFSYM